MRAIAIWTPLGELDLERDGDLDAAVAGDPVLALLGRALAACSTAELGAEPTAKSRGEATEVGAARGGARRSGIDVDVARRERRRRRALPLRPDAAPDVDRRRARRRQRSPCTPRARPRRCSRAATLIGRPRRTHVPLDDGDARARCWRCSSATPRRACASSPSRGGGSPTAPAAGAARGGRARPLPARARRAVRPAAAGGRRRGRALPRGRHPHHRRHRRLRADGRRDRPPRRHRRDGSHGRHRRPSSTG